MKPNMSSRWKRSIAIDLPCGSLTADKPPPKKRTIYISNHNTAFNGGNDDAEMDKVLEHDAASLTLGDQLHGLVDRAHAPDWREATDASHWIHASESPLAWPDLQTSPSIVKHSNHHHHHRQNELEIYNSLETRELCKKQDWSLNHETRCPSELDVPLQEATDASHWLHASESPFAWPDLQTSPSIAEHSNHHHHHHRRQNESEICNSVETCELCKKQDWSSNHETRCPSKLEAPLQDFERSAQSLFQAVSNWSWKSASGSVTENAVSYKDHTEHLGYDQHPAPWLISTHWVPTLLMACAKSISKEDTESTNHLMWVLNSLASPKGASLDCRMASYFLHALQCKVSGTGRAVQKRISEAIQNLKIDLERGVKKQLVWREVTPWSAFGQEAANAAIFEALKGEDMVHVVDVSQWSSLCMQWPALVEALATRREGAPHFRLTVMIMQSEGTVLREAMKAISNKITRFAHLMGLPSFKFNVIYEPALEEIDAHTLDVRIGEALVVNFNQTLQYLPTRASKYGGESPRDMTLKKICKCNPKIMVVVENEVDQLSNTFADRFCSLYQFVSVFLGSMDRPDMPANQARLHVQEEVAKIMIVNSVACDENNGEERKHGEEFYHGNLERIAKREQTGGWTARLNLAGFKSVCLGDDVLHRVEMLLKMYPSYWALRQDSYQKDQAVGVSPSSLTLTWRGYPIHTCTVWAPIQ